MREVRSLVSLHTAWTALPCEVAGTQASQPAVPWGWGCQRNLWKRNKSQSSAQRQLSWPWPLGVFLLSLSRAGNRPRLLRRLRLPGQVRKQREFPSSRALPRPVTHQAEKPVFLCKNQWLQGSPPAVGSHSCSSLHHHCFISPTRWVSSQTKWKPKERRFGTWRCVWKDTRWNSMLLKRCFNR